MLPASHSRPSSPAVRGGSLCLAVRSFCALAFGLLALAAAAADKPAKDDKPAQSSESCLECHADAKLTTKGPAGEHSLFVDPKTLAGSAHSSYECVDCHDGLDGQAKPHRAEPVRVDCTSCHDDVAKKHKFHQALTLNPLPKTKETDCVACHGSHGVAGKKSALFPFAKARLVEGCGKCHDTARDDFTHSAHGRSLSAKTAAAPNCLTCHDTPGLVTPKGQSTIEQKLAQAKLCESCHVEKKEVASQVLRGTKFVASFDRSVHGAALLAGKKESATCVDCHGAHQMNRAIVPTARVSKQRQSATCGTCHHDQAVAFDSSVHAAALRQGNADAASCTDCHGEHDMRGHKDPTSPVNAANLARDVCANCHASVKLSRKYGMTSDAFQTFSDSYHGLAARGGSVEVVNCASCHRAHDIKASSDPTSSISKENLVRTCGECHRGANNRFTIGAVHSSPEAQKGKTGQQGVLYLVATIYTWMIVLVVGGMAVHNLLDFLKKVRRKLAIQKGLLEPEHVAHRLYLRMTAHERLQHATLVISFMLLVVTGFMLRYPEAWWVVGIRDLSSRAFEFRGLIHRIAGVALLSAGVWHICYLAFTRPGRSLLMDLLPRWRDVTDPWKVLRYNLGLAPTKPEFPRFSYIEKAEYWALVWGTLLMGVTDVILWFDNTSMGLLTKLGFDISRTIHFYEAVLATLAIVVWHFYFVIFNPDVYPMNLAWLTGRMSEEELLEEHPLELARLKAAEAAKAKAAAARPPPPPDEDASGPAEA